jgi:hypothetical protein
LDSSENDERSGLCSRRGSSSPLKKGSDPLRTSSFPLFFDALQRVRPLFQRTTNGLLFRLKFPPSCGFAWQDLNGERPFWSVISVAKRLFDRPCQKVRPLDDPHLVTGFGRKPAVALITDLFDAHVRRLYSEHRFGLSAPISAESVRTNNQWLRGLECDRRWCRAIFPLKRCPDPTGVAKSHQPDIAAVVRQRFTSKAVKCSNYLKLSDTRGGLPQNCGRLASPMQ